MISIEDFVNTPTATIQINWNLVESVLGFRIHDGLKDFYSRMRCDKERCIRGACFVELFNEPTAHVPHVPDQSVDLNYTHYAHSKMISLLFRMRFLNGQVVLIWANEQ